MKRDWLDWIALLLTVAIIVFILFIPPVVGLADEGDFVKITGKFDLYLPQGQKNGFADTTYSSEAILARIPAGLSSACCMVFKGGSVISSRRTISRLYSFIDRLDPPRHAYLFNAMTDLAVILILGLILARRVQTGAVLSRL